MIGHFQNGSMVFSTYFIFLPTNRVENGSGVNSGPVPVKIGHRKKMKIACGTKFFKHASNVLFICSILLTVVRSIWFEKLNFKDIEQSGRKLSYYSWQKYYFPTRSIFTLAICLKKFVLLEIFILLRCPILTTRCPNFGGTANAHRLRQYFIEDIFVLPN